MGATGVVMAKNKYEEGTPEYEAYELGVREEQDRMLKVLKVYHQRFGEGDLKDSTETMQIKYLYDYIMETRSLK